MSSLTINKIIKDIEVKKLKDLYGEFNNVIELISKFIIKKNLILYGGLVINYYYLKNIAFIKSIQLMTTIVFLKIPSKMLMNLRI
jgi:hypothetical protein